MASFTAADLFICWTNNSATGVAGNNVLNTINFPENRLETPETTASEGGISNDAGEFIVDP